jgi:hypothetical protein
MLASLTVTLSAAKGQTCVRRCFAEFTLSATNGLSMTARTHIYPVTNPRPMALETDSSCGMSLLN